MWADKGPDIIPGKWIIYSMTTDYCQCGICAWRELWRHRLNTISKRNLRRKNLTTEGFIIIGDSLFQSIIRFAESWINVCLNWEALWDTCPREMSKKLEKIFPVSDWATISKCRAQTQKPVILLHQKTFMLESTTESPKDIPRMRTALKVENVRLGELVSRPIWQQVVLQGQYIN